MHSVLLYTSNSVKAKLSTPNLQGPKRGLISLLCWDWRMICKSIELNKRRLCFVGKQRNGWSEGDIRLVDGTTSKEGRVEIYHNGDWGTVCSQDFDSLDAQVVCQQLGYQTSNAVPYSSDRYGEGNGKIWLAEVTCHGNEVLLADCLSWGWGFTYFCSHEQDIGVSCNEKSSQALEGNIRLVNGASLDDKQGRLEIYHNGYWGTVCGEGFDDTDAQVVCRQLGYSSSSAIAYGSDFYGRGSGQIWLGKVDCHGSEKRLSDCDSSGFGFTYYCSHSQDVGVNCSKYISLDVLIHQRALICPSFY
jgi:deleted-in-malignant-brain-tumors protein 1